MILIEFIDITYKFILKIFYYCIIQIPIPILINTDIKNFLKLFYNKIISCSISEENKGYHFIQKGYLFHTILIKLFLEKIWYDEI